MSLFNNLGALGLSPEEINKVNRWRDALKIYSDEGRAIEKNCQLETRVTDKIRRKFLRRIIRNWQERGDRNWQERGDRVDKTCRSFA